MLKQDVLEIEKLLERNHPDKWSESCEVMKSYKIPFEKFNGFVDTLQQSFEGNSIILVQTFHKYMIL